MDSHQKSCGKATVLENVRNAWNGLRSIWKGCQKERSTYFSRRLRRKLNSLQGVSLVIIYHDYTATWQVTAGRASTQRDIYAFATPHGQCSAFCADLRQSVGFEWPPSFSQSHGHTTIRWKTSMLKECPLEYRVMTPLLYKALLAAQRPLCFWKPIKVSGYK